ncbi:hypothetical protein GGF46_000469 [Coemansia sp. RSA 552]|nr:hypothetical protein GGF46_000469 [Coemansia sp. RSA 552]
MPTVGDASGPRRPAFVARARRRAPEEEPAAERDGEEQAASAGSGPSRVANLIKLVVFAWFSRWFIRYFEVDRSLRGEPGTPQISMTWLVLALCSLLPFVSVYLYASVWRRRILGEPLDLQNWQADSSTLVHGATVGLLFAWGFAIVAFFPGYGLKSLIIVAVGTVCTVALIDAVEGIF